MLVWKGLGDVHRWINGRLLEGVLKRLQNLTAAKVKLQYLIFKLQARLNQTNKSENKQGQQVKRPGQQPRTPPRRAENGINIFEDPSLPFSGPQT